jgi:hypothetical protein
MNVNDDATATKLALVCIVVLSLLNAYKWYQGGLPVLLYRLYR